MEGELAAWLQAILFAAGDGPVSICAQATYMSERWMGITVIQLALEVRS